MAKAKGGFFRGLFKFILTLVIICAIIIGVAYFTTPNTFGLGDKQIAGKSFNEMGIADMRFTDVALMCFKMIKEPKESDMVVTADSAKEEDYTSVVDKTPEAQSGTVGSGEEESFNYGSLLTNEAVFTEEKEVTLTNSELTALFNLVFQQFNGGGSGDVNFDGEGATTSEPIDPTITEEMVVGMFKSFSAEFKSVSPVMSGTTVKIDTVATFVIPQELRQGLGQININIAEKIYIRFSNTYEIVEGKLVQIDSEADYFFFNNMNQEQSDGLIGLVFSNLDIKGVSAQEMSKEYCNVLGEVMIRIINNFGTVSSVGGNSTTIKTNVK